MNKSECIKYLIKRLSVIILLLPMPSIADDILLAESTDKPAKTKVNTLTNDIDRGGTSTVGISTKQELIPTSTTAQRSSAIKYWTLTAEQWEIARSGESVLSLTMLKDLVTTWLTAKTDKQAGVYSSAYSNTDADKDAIIEIQYPGGEEGEFWVHELTDWLVALGIPSSFMLLTPGSGADDEIKLQLSNH